MGFASGKSKKLVVYQDKKTMSIFLRPTKVVKGRFRIKQFIKGTVGMAKPNSISDKKLGKFVREALNQCD